MEEEEEEAVALLAVSLLALEEEMEEHGLCPGVQVRRHTVYVHVTHVQSLNCPVSSPISPS